MKYTELKAKHSAKLNDFPMFFAFSDTQFEEGLEKLSATTEEICSIPGGGFIRKVDSKLLEDLLLGSHEELQEAMKDDTFMIDAIKYELGNHEYIITYDPDEALSELDLSLEDERTLRLFKIALKNYLDWQEEHKREGG